MKDQRLPPENSQHGIKLNKNYFLKKTKTYDFKTAMAWIGQTISKVKMLTSVE